MLLRKILLISLILISCANADTIYNIIKIPHLEIYKSKTSNKINYLQSTKPFQVGIMKNNITCFQTKIDLYKEKFKIIERSFNKYPKNFLKKINLKYVVICEDLSVSQINAAGFADQKMKTIIFYIKTDTSLLERIVHHEVFHIINDAYKSNFIESKWKKFNKMKFQYQKCSTCSNLFGLSLLKKNEGFFSEYSMSTASEDMAEVFSFLMTDKNIIEKKINKDLILKKKVFFIKENILKIDDKFKF